MRLGVHFGGVAVNRIVKSNPRPVTQHSGFSSHNWTTRKLSEGRSKSVQCQASLSDLIPVALFFTPGLCALVYAYFKGKGNLKDGLSRSDGDCMGLGKKDVAISGVHALA